ncbi:hypothetical protein B0T13DRAFT_515277 [Neurospora crassa]|nr:hypothetical protein B0T13DRAFT_515277 [Neurospora crassa]
MAVHMQTFQGYPLALSPIKQLLIIKILNKEAKEGHVDDIKQFFVNQLYAVVSSVHTRKSDARTHQETMAQQIHESDRISTCKDNNQMPKDSI